MHSTFFHTLLSCGRSFNYRFFFSRLKDEKKSLRSLSCLSRLCYEAGIGRLFRLFYLFIFIFYLQYHLCSLGRIYIYMLSHRRSQFWGSRVWAQWAWQVSIRNLSLAIIIDAVLTLLKWSMIFIKMYKRKKIKFEWKTSYITSLSNLARTGNGEENWNNCAVSVRPVAADGELIILTLC